MSMSASPEKDSYQLWRSSNLAVLEKLMHEKTAITLSLPNGFDGNSTGLQVTGLFSLVKGNVARFFIQKRAPLEGEQGAPGSSKNIPCGVAFTVMQASLGGYLEPIGYTGSGEILAVENGPNGEPLYLSVRVAHRFTTRRVRRHFRLDWTEDMPVTAGLQVVSDVPQNRHELRSILETALHDASTRPRIVNISAGGVCLGVDKDMASRPLAGREFYMFIFSCPRLGKNRPPEILICKKVGLRRDVGGEGRMGLRFKFMHELNWHASQIVLAWRDIADMGSASIDKLVDAYCAELFPAQ